MIDNIDISFAMSRDRQHAYKRWSISDVTNMSAMFYQSVATTGYARTQTDADKFNASDHKPAGLTFIVKP